MIKIERKKHAEPQTMPEERTETPVQPTEAPVLASVGPAAHGPQKRQIKPFTALDGVRNYRALYRAACDFHERHSPPRITDDAGAAYWEQVGTDMTETCCAFNNDQFLIGLLLAIYEELEREYQVLTGAAASF